MTIWIFILNVDINLAHLHFNRNCSNLSGTLKLCWVVTQVEVAVEVQALGSAIGEEKMDKKK